ncbi:hypothetical protein RvY_12923-2 [Ramazzottius varieornatus]|uniref:RanBP2-type domain-containing protein n=1 Tax=Ramazzottius varieornatus TaxID=947166 RepID=A0A1D1VN39_RAMVA|nr:hypothetical protein RvY_12923-2 [Ramazzottius varieornatus]
MDPEDNDRETENGQWNYLDGTPARLNEDVGRGTSLLEQTVSDVVHMLNPFSWFRKKPSRPNSQQVGQQRRPINAERNWNASSRRPLNSHNVVSNQDERPAKRHRPGFSSELDYADAGLPRGTQGSIDEEMPPNVEFTADERPTAQPSSSKSYNDMMTDDEDDDQPSRPSTSNNRNSIFTLNRPNQPSKFFASSAAKSEANARRSMPVQSPERKTTLLPLIETHNLNRSTLRNPLMEQTKLSPMMTPTPSRKRGFDAVDRDERGEVPKLFSMFPKTSERTTVLSRFGSPAKFGEESNKKTSQPLYAMKRLETLKNGDFTQSRDARTTSLSPFKALPSLNRNTNTVDSPSKLMNNSISRKTAPVKLDYSYVIQSPSPTSSRGQFAFVAAVTVPNGELAKAVKAATRDDRESSVVSGSTEMNTSARLCNKCGISVKADGGNKCEVCERLKSPGKKVVDGEKDDEPMEVRKPSTSRAKENTAQNEVWSCDLCGENNREETSCKSCGKSRKSTKASPSESAKQDSSPKRAPLSSPTPNEQSKEDEKSAPSAKPKETSSTPQSSAPNKPPSTSAAGSSAPVNDLWSKLGQAKQWTCSECWTGNDDQKTQCAACGKAKPGTEQNTTATTAPAKPAFSFGGPQADPPAKPASTIPPATGFSFGGAQPASNASKPASDAPAVSSNLFGFGNPSAPKLAAPSTGSTSGGFSGFSGFGNLPGW